MRETVSRKEHKERIETGIPRMKFQLIRVAFVLPHPGPLPKERENYPPSLKKTSI